MGEKYFVLLVICLFCSVFGNQTSTWYVQIQDNGKDEVQCLHNITNIACRTLTYVLSNIGNITSPSITVEIASSQVVESQNINTLNPQTTTLVLYGVGNPTLDFMNEEEFNINFQGSMVMVGLVLTNAKYLEFSYDLRLVNVSNCTFSQFFQVAFSGQFEHVYFNEIFVHNNNISKICLFCFVLTPYSQQKISIKNSKFVNNTGETPSSPGPILNFFSNIYTPLSSVDIAIDRCNFESNNVSILHLKETSNIGLNFTNCVMKNNINLIDPLIKINMTENCTEDNFFQCSFIFSTIEMVNNKGVCLQIDMRSLPVQSTSLDFLIENCNFSGNILPLRMKDIHQMLIISVSSEDIQLHIKRVIFDGNIIAYSNTTDISAIVKFNSVKAIDLVDIKVQNNIGTPFYLQEASLNFNKSVHFFNNTGIFGGAMYFDQNSILFVSKDTQIIFEKNVALIGGAVFISTTSCSFMQCFQNTSVLFQSNIASTLGDNVYLENPFCKNGIIFTGGCNIIPNKTKSLISTGPYEIIFDSPTIELFSGQEIVVNANVSGLHGNPSECVATIILQCGDQYLNCKDMHGNQSIEMVGNTKTILINGTNHINLHFVTLNSLRSHNTIQQPKLIFQCDNIGTQGSLNINLKTCPLGYIFQSKNNDNALGSCVCKDSNDDIIKCDTSLGITCIKRGYWFGEVDDKYTIAKCHYPYCATSLSSCPIKEYANSYFELPSTSDDMCNALHGGVLCKGCKTNTIFTFEAVKCLPVSKCNRVHKFIILLLVFILQIILGLILVMTMRLDFASVSGYLLGPLFFLAILGKFQLHLHEDLNITVSLFRSIFLLNLEIFGHLPWCFFPMNVLFNYSFHFLGPTIIIIVVMLTVPLARCFPRFFLRLQRQPVRAICILLIISYWSLTETCINYLKWIVINGTLKVAIQPDVNYLSWPHHTIFFMVSLIIIVFLLAPCVILLLFSQQLFKYKIMNYFKIRIEPFLNDLQSVYKDKLRWYSGIYLVTATICMIAPYSWLTLILAFITGAHLILQPYGNQWLNKVDSIILLDLILLNHLISQAEQDLFNSIVIYILVFIPIVYLIFGCIILQCRRPLQQCRKSSQNIWEQIRNRFDKKHVNCEDESLLDHD